VQIPFELSPSLFNPGSDELENARCLRVLLDTLIDLNSVFLRHHAAVPLYNSGVVYGRTVTWDMLPVLYAKKKGDCKSLTAAYIAIARKSGIQCEPTFRFKRKPNGTILYHILVQLKRPGRFGSVWEDPSKILGMGKDENAWARM
jgi:hypothetical protein